MTSTELTEPPRAGGAPDHHRPAESAEPTVRETLDETLPLVGLIPVHGLAAVLIAGPWVLFALPLSEPFALLFTLAVLVAAAAALVAGAGEGLTPAQRCDPSHCQPIPHKESR